MDGRHRARRTGQCVGHSSHARRLGTAGHDCRCGRRNRTRREPGQERRMALPPILQPRRISPRQKIASRCAWRNSTPTKTCHPDRSEAEWRDLLSTLPEILPARCGALRECGEQCRQLGAKTSMRRPRDLLPTTGLSTALAALRFGRDDSANTRTHLP